MTHGPQTISMEDRSVLLELARRSITLAVSGQALPVLDLEALPARLREDGVCFVTLFNADGGLRGCIGGLEATRPLAQDVCEHAAAAALDDFRFRPVQPEEVVTLCIEISVLTPPTSLVCDNPAALPSQLRPGIDGVILRDGMHRATFLPQVWEKLPDPCSFLSHLCQKMGAPADLWKRKCLQVEVYQVEEFHDGA